MRLLPKLILTTVVTLSVTTSVIAHQGSLNQLPWVACEDKVLNDACEFYNSNEDKFRGTCQSISEVLMCVRNQPIEYATDRQGEHTHDDEQITTEQQSH